MKSLKQYLRECGSGDLCFTGPQTVAEPPGTLTDKKDPYAGALSGFGKPRKFGKEQRKRKLKNLRESFNDYNKFLKLWDLKGWFWHAFYPYTGNQTIVEEFCNVLDTKGFSISENLKPVKGTEDHSQPEKEIKFLQDLFKSEPKLEQYMGECLDQFCQNIKDTKPLLNCTGIEFSNPGELYQISESITWQDVLDEKPVQTVGGYKVDVVKLIYSEEQILGQFTDSDNNTFECVWNREGKCISKTDKESNTPSSILDDDNLDLM